MHELVIEGVIGAGWWGDVSSAMVRDSLKGQEDVNVIINSVGGDVFEGVAIMSQLLRHPGQVNVLVEGIAASIASVIAMGGNEIVMTNGSQLMIHSPWTATIGDAGEHQRSLDALNASKASILDIYQERTNNGRESIEAWVDAETWFTAEEAVAAGFADRVEGVTTREVAVPADLYLHTPAACITAPAEVQRTIEAKVWKARIAGMMAEIKKRRA